MSKKIPFISVGENELGDYIEKDSKVKCPNCNKLHKVIFSIDKDGIEGGLIAVQCPKNNNDYLVGVSGRFMNREK